MVRRFPATDGLDMKTCMIQLLVVMSLLSCRNANKTDMTMETIESALQSASEEFMKFDGVVGVGQGKNEKNKDCIILFTSEDSAAIAPKTPTTYKGFDVVITPLGDIKAQ